MAGIKITWLGHAAFLLEAEKRLLIDPFISGNPMAPCTPEELNPDVLVITHGHQDHLGDAIEIGKRAGCRIISIHEVANFIKSKGVFAEGMNKGGTMNVEGIKLTMTNALHSSSIDASGFCIHGRPP